MTTGERIRFYRRQKGITLKELGKKAGFQNSGDVRIAQYEGGARVPKAETLEKIAGALGVPADALCCTASAWMKCRRFRRDTMQELSRKKRWLFRRIVREGNLGRLKQKMQMSQCR